MQVMASSLKGPAGATFPARSVHIFGMKPQPMGDISSLGEGRIVGGEMLEIGGGNLRYGDWTGTKARALVSFAPKRWQVEPPPPRPWAGFNTSTGSPPRCRSGFQPIPANPIGCR